MMNTYCITQETNLFTPKEWQRLSTITSNIENEHDLIETSIIDDNPKDIISVNVFRFIEYTNSISSVKHPKQTKLITELLKQSNFIQKIEHISGVSNLKIARMQINWMEKDSYLKPHRDTDFGEKFLFTIILNLSQNTYSGGELRIYKGKKILTIKQNAYSCFILSSGLQHEVLKVTNRTRKRLVIVLSVS